MQIASKVKKNHSKADLAITSYYKVTTFAVVLLR
jgi:hypothetical protein